MSLVFDFANIAARMNNKPEPIKVVIDHGAAHTAVSQLPSHTHSLATGEMPSHTHTITDPVHTHNIFWRKTRSATRLGD